MQGVMTPVQVLEALGSIDLGKWGSGRARLVAKIGRSPEGVRGSYREIAGHVGMGERYVYRLLRELVAARVLQADPGKGRRPTVYRVHPYVEDWRDVPWCDPPELVALRCFHVEVAARQEALEGLVVPRSVSAARALVVPRSVSAADHPRSAAPTERGTTAPAADLVPRPGARHNVDPVPRSGARHYGEAPRVVGVPVSPGAGDPVSYSVDPATVDQVAKALMRATGARYCNGAPRRRLEGLIAAYGAQAIRDALEAAPGELGLPALVEWLAAELAPDLTPSGDARSLVSEERRAAVIARLAALQEHAARYATEAGEVPESVLSELQQCENELATYTSKGDAA